METVLKEANEIILRQRDQIRQAQDNQQFKDKLKQLEQDHLKEKKESQRTFEVFKQSAAEKEARLEKSYKEKAADMKLEVMEAKKKFEQRCEEFKRQLLEFKNNNEAIDALKKAHAKELAAHV